MINSLAFLPVDKVAYGVKALLGEVVEELVPVVNWFKENYVERQTGGFKIKRMKNIDYYIRVYCLYYIRRILGRNF